ncbi:MAG TPA: non-canonical purine NTP pyrophosphatase [Nocardioides sp.]|uniref:non-canonical purine NTP pyrophosphatase n=1 Tax=Nocardioides sp. TaxID=35761 RepID=UPI002E363734|nr:non-canonical purine NTP pyrophosphatase [Nocardioides sp.]HEX3929286.1 non-canonical purine NTP pyrophosphatase [Nocardioides sp.]
MTQVFLASRNVKKLEEMRRILTASLSADRRDVAGAAGTAIEVLGLDDVAAYDEPVEDEPTFAGNALLKARAALAATGLPSVADDSGLCVDALNGMPGVLSARWSGGPRDDRRALDRGNNELLLQQLSDVPDGRRGAHFASAVAFCAPAEPAGQPLELVVEDRMTGRVTRETRGSGGFGYDVLFCADEFPDRTTAELDPAQKDAISHRGRALRRIAPQIVAALTR